VRGVLRPAVSSNLRRPYKDIPAKKHSANYFTENTFPILDKVIEEVIEEYKRKTK